MTIRPQCQPLPSKATGSILGQSHKKMSTNECHCQLEGDQCNRKSYLGFPELPEEGLVACAKGASGTSEAGAAADSRAAWERTIVPGPNATSIQVLRAVSDGRRPLANNEPEVEA